MVSLIPVLDEPCWNCQTPAAQQARKQAYRQWRRDLADAYEQAAQKTGIGYEDWLKTNRAQNILARRPDPPEGGCDVCNWSTRLMTDSGKDVWKFVKFWQGVKNQRKADSDDPDTQDAAAGR